MKRQKKTFIILLVSIILLLTITIDYALKLPPEPPVQKEISPEKIDDSVKLGVDFLKNQIARNNWLLNCKATDGSPCPVHNQGAPFAAFFIAESANSELSSIEKEKITARLNGEEKNGLWGYAPNAPVDSDDTAFALRALKLLNAEKPLDGIITFYNKQENGFLTFKSDISSPNLVFRPGGNNNFHIHPEVNANIYNLIRDTAYENYINYDIIINSQAPGGYWHSYFYPSNYYSAYQNLKSIGLLKNYGEAKRKTVNFILNSQNKDGSWGNPGNPYETSLALKSLAILNVFNEHFRKGTKFLLNSQNKDGSWENPAIIWEYVHKQNPKILWRAFDKNKIISTSLSINALKDAKRKMIKE